MNIDFKSEAVDFARKNGCPPACIIQKAMERGAEIAIAQCSLEIKSLNDELARKRAMEILTIETQHGNQLRFQPQPNEYPAADFQFSKKGLAIISKSQSSELEHTIEGKFADGSMRLNMARLATCVESLKSPAFDVLFSPTAMVLRSGELTVMIGKMFK